MGNSLFQNKHHRSKPFTLIEMVVVIAIIGILASLLLPALAGAKDKAVQAQYLSRQRQVGVAIYSYMDDFNGYMPYSNTHHNLNSDMVPNPSRTGSTFTEDE